MEGWKYRSFYSNIKTSFAFICKKTWLLTGNSNNVFSPCSLHILQVKINLNFSAVVCVGERERSARAQQNICERRKAGRERQKLLPPSLFPFMLQKKRGKEQNLNHKSITTGCTINVVQ